MQTSRQRRLACGRPHDELCLADPPLGRPPLGGDLRSERGSRRLASAGLLVGGGFQVVFGALWLARGVAVFAPPLVAVAAGGTALVLGLTAAAATRHWAPRPQGPAARRFEHRLTVATVGQIVASFVLPVLIGAAVGPRLAVPSIVLTIGILLAWIHREGRATRYATRPGLAWPCWADVANRAVAAGTPSSLPCAWDSVDGTARTKV